MGYTKRQFVNAAFEELGLASYAFDLSPDALQSAVQRLDAMVAVWYEKGIQIGWPATGSPQNASLDSETNVPQNAFEAVITNLAIRLAPSVGKTVSMDTRMSAKQGYDLLLINAAKPQQMQFPDSLPIGAGVKSQTLISPFCLTPDTAPIQLGENGELVLE